MLTFIAYLHCLYYPAVELEADTRRGRIVFFIRHLLLFFLPSILSPFLPLHKIFSLFAFSKQWKPSVSQTFKALCYLPLFVSTKAPASQRRERVPLEKTPVHHNTAAAVMDRGERWGQAGQPRAEGPPDNRVECLALRGRFGQITLSSCEEIRVLHPLYCLSQL